MQHTGFSATGKTCLFRKATTEDTEHITRLIRASSIHVQGLNKQHANPHTMHLRMRRALSNCAFFLFASRLQWRNYIVAVSPEGAVIGCCQVKTHRCGIRETDTLCVDKDWRNGTVAARLMRYVIANTPHPMWGTCMDNVVAFQKRNGGVQVTDPGLMPPFLRRP